MNELTEDVVVAEEAGEAFLLHVPSGRYFGLNPAGLVIWRALEQRADPVDALTDRFPSVPVDVLRADADALLERLREAGLCRLRGAE